MKKRIVCILLCLTLLPLCPSLFAGAYTVSLEGRLPFSDVPEGKWYTDAVKFVYANQEMRGTSQSTFSPNAAVTREQAVTILANISGDDLSSYNQQPFADVPVGMWYSCSVAWAKSKGYTNGIGGGYFGLGRTITREEFVVILFNYSQKKGYDADSGASLAGFSDYTKISSWAKTAMSWAVNKSIISGTDNGLLAPQKAITRSETAIIVKSFIYNCVHASCEHNFSAATCTRASECPYCHLKAGLPNGHYCPTLTCTEGSNCLTCGTFVSPAGHKYSAATCTQPMKCTVCQSVGSKPLGHTTSDGICARCSKEIFKDNYRKLLYYIKQRGTQSGSDKVISCRVTNPNVPGYALASVIYSGSDNMVLFRYVHYFENSNDKLEVTLRIPGICSSYTYTTYYSDDKEVLYCGSGNINAQSFSRYSKFALTEYWGDKTKKEELTDLTKKVLLLNLDAADSILKKYIGLNISHFGFSKP